jgi:DNA-binding cell septation regulator SpoVG
MANSTQAGEKKSLSVDEEIEMMRKAPIQELADYLHIDLDLAVQLRVDQAVSDTYDKIAEKRGPIAQDLYSKWASEQELGKLDITVRPIEPLGNLYGFASVTVHGIRIDDFKIVENKEGELFVGVPSKPDKGSKTGFRNTVHIEKGYKANFDDAVIRNYYAAVEQAKSRAASFKDAPDKPERMADQMAKAEKEAERHNADLPKAEKTGKKREAGRE